MTGAQQTIADGLRGILEKVLSGAFGQDDDFDFVAFDDDLTDAVEREGGI